MHWQTQKELIVLLDKLVSVPSVSRTNTEKEIPYLLYDECMKLDYFKKNQAFLKNHQFDDGSSFFTALVKNGDKKKTLILISHFDVVGVEDYGFQKDIAFDIEKMTDFYKENQGKLPKHVQEEISKGDWIFGRGSMDMKAGLAVQLGLLEKATIGTFDGNVLLVTVSDEEVGSKGMLRAVEEIKKLKEEHDLEYVLCLNSEPSFKENPFDQNKYIYTGTIGKLMPTFFFRGQETHVGEPFAGLNASYMCSVLTNELELCSDFQEIVEGEKTPVLTNLMLRDLKPSYNVQTPVSSVSMFNLLYMEKNLNVIVEKLLSKTKDIATEILNSYRVKAQNVGVEPISFQIKVLTWDELYKNVINEIGKEKTDIVIEKVINENESLDEREKSLKIVRELSSYLSDKSPMIVLYFSPPFYPAVSSRENTLIKEISSQIENYAKDIHKVDIHKRNFFPGLCDLSYVSIGGNDPKELTDNMPLFNKGYDISFDKMKEFDFPVLNLGPYGSDPHQKTERLELDFSFSVLPDLLERLTRELFILTEKY